MKTIEPLIEQMKEIRWFQNCGLVFPGPITLEIRPIGSWNEALKTRGRNAASNAFLNGVNLLTKETAIRFKNEDRKWNSFAAEGRDALESRIFPRLDSVIDGISELSLEFQTFLKDSVRWDLIHIILEHVYSDLVPPRFYATILEVYRTGHFPCHWDEVWPDGTLWVY